MLRRNCCGPLPLFLELDIPLGDGFLEVGLRRLGRLPNCQRDRLELFVGRDLVRVQAFAQTFDRRPKTLGVRDLLRLDALDLFQ